MPTSVALTAHFDAFIEQQLSSGRYSDASEVVRDGLRLLERQQAQETLKLDVLRRAAQAGFNAIDVGDFIELAPDEIAAAVATLGEPVAAGLQRPSRTTQR